MDSTPEQLRFASIPGCTIRAQHAMGGHIVRTIGLARAKVKIGMMNLVYNMKRLGQLLKREAQAALAASKPHGRGVSAVA